MLQVFSGVDRLIRAVGSTGLWMSVEEYDGDHYPDLCHSIPA